MKNNKNKEQIIVVPLSILEKKDKNAINENSILLSKLNDSSIIIKNISIVDNELHIQHNDIPTHCTTRSTTINNSLNLQNGNKGFSISLCDKDPNIWNTANDKHHLVLGLVVMQLI